MAAIMVFISLDDEDESTYLVFARDFPGILESHVEYSIFVFDHSSTKIINPDEDVKSATV